MGGYPVRGLQVIPQVVDEVEVSSLPAKAENTPFLFSLLGLWSLNRRSRPLSS
jgi:hypothetical protein